MAKVIHHGWSKPGDDIPQPTSIVMGANLRKSEPPSPDRPFGWHLRDIERWVKEQQKLEAETSRARRKPRK